MSDLFISYAAADRERLKFLISGLEQRGWTVWWDRIIRAGKTWDKVIEEELDRARCVLVVWSFASVNSEWVRVEADEAYRRRILVPVLFDEVRIPLAFRRIQAARLIGWSGDLNDSGFEHLCAAISDVLASPEEEQRSSKANDNLLSAPPFTGQEQQNRPSPSAATPETPQCTELQGHAASPSGKSELQRRLQPFKDAERRRRAIKNADKRPEGRSDRPDQQRGATDTRVAGEGDAHPFIDESSYRAVSWIIKLVIVAVVVFVICAAALQLYSNP
jgi:hypothetical protein